MSIFLTQPINCDSMGQVKPLHRSPSADKEWAPVLGSGL